MKKSVGVCLAVVGIGAAAALGIMINRSTESMEVGTENDSKAGIVTELPDGLTVFSDEGSFPPLWKVTNEGGTMYMLGSLHAVPPEAYPLDGRVKEAYDQCTAVAVEHKNVDAVDLISSADKQYTAVCAEGDELKNHLTEQQYTLVREAAVSSGFDLAELDRMLPWCVYTNLSVIASTADDTGASGLYGVDRVFQILANIDGKKKYSIESDEAKTAFYPEMPEDVLGLLIERELTADNYKDIYRAWTTGDLDGLYSVEYSADGLSEADTAIFMRGVDYMLTKRNHAMAEKAKEFLASGETVFFIAGTAHFCGGDGIPALLESSGCTVERVQ